MLRCSLATQLQPKLAELLAALAADMDDTADIVIPAAMLTNLRAPVMPLERQRDIAAVVVNPQAAVYAAPIVFSEFL